MSEVPSGVVLTLTYLLCEFPNYRKKRNVLSSLGGSLGISYGSDDDDNLKVTGGSTQRSDQVSSPSELGSSPSPTGTGYVPSAMEHRLVQS